MNGTGLTTTKRRQHAGPAADDYERESAESLLTWQVRLVPASIAVAVLPPMIGALCTLLMILLVIAL